MKKINQYLLWLLIVLQSAQAQLLTPPSIKLNSTEAQSALQGPAMPCPDCTQEFTNTIVTPHAGSWYNPQQSGTGFLFDIQNNILAGYYFGYDEAGAPIWSYFSARLEDGSERGGLWQIQAALYKYQGGACINCDYQAPEVVGSYGELDIVFNRLAHASFSIDGGEVQNIVPLYFGYALLDYADQTPAYRIPDLEGWWTVFDNEEDSTSGLPDIWTYNNYMVHIRKGRIGRFDELVFSMLLYAGAPEIIPIGNIKCRNSVASGVNQTKCEFANNPYFPDYDIDLANITGTRIYGESENGDRIEMIKLSSDSCPSTNNPENCINTGLYDYLDNGGG